MILQMVECTDTSVQQVANVYENRAEIVNVIMHPLQELKEHLDAYKARAQITDRFLRCVMMLGGTFRM